MKVVVAFLLALTVSTAAAFERTKPRTDVVDEVVNQRALYDLSYEDCIYGCFYSTESFYDFNNCADECGSPYDDDYTDDGRSQRGLRGDADDSSSLTGDDQEVSTDADVVANNGGDGKEEMSTDEVINQRALYSPFYDDCVRFCGYSADTDEEFYECADYCEIEKKR
eukprot:scaffold99356_cov23-Cyclotella_meneghiniana.AAC.1